MQGLLNYQHPPGIKEFENHCSKQAQTANICLRNACDRLTNRHFCSCSELSPPAPCRAWTSHRKLFFLSLINLHPQATG